MLVAEPVDTHSQRFHPCLDLLRVRFDYQSPARMEEDAVLLEVSEKGGLLQTDQPIPPGTSFSLFHRSQPVLAHVDACSEDDYGFLLEFTVEDSAGWFPRGYQPHYLLPEPGSED